MTSEESLLWFSFLKKLDVKFRAQHPIDNYIVDFYSPSLKLVIELDGVHHLTKANLQYDQTRDKALKMYGIHILRIANYEIRKNFSDVCCFYSP